MCLTPLSDVVALLGCYAAEVGSWFLQFRDRLLVPSWRVNQSKEEEEVEEVEEEEEEEENKKTTSILYIHLQEEC
jgi:hypothetical protein